MFQALLSIPIVFFFQNKELSLTEQDVYKKVNEIEDPNLHREAISCLTDSVAALLQAQSLTTLENEGNFNWLSAVN